MKSAALQQAWALFSRGRFAEAEEQAHRAFSADPAEAELILGIVCARSGRHVEAISWLEAAVGHDPHRFEAVNWLSYVYSLAGRAEDAEPPARKAIQLRPTNEDAWNNLGLALHGQGKYSEAATAYETSIRHGGAGTAYRNLGSAYWFADRVDEAERALKKALSLGEKKAPVYTLLSEIATKKNRLSLARSWIDQALALDPKSLAARRQLAVVLIHEEKPADAEALLSEILAEHAGDAPTLLVQAMALQTQGKFNEAKRSLEACLAASPESAEAYSLLFRSEKVGEALMPYVERARALVRDGALAGAKRISVNYALGKANHDLGHYAAAMEHYNEANRLTKELFRLDARFDAAEYQKSIDAIISRFGAEVVGPESDFGLETKQPIFIVGMIRSGTSLMEQIVSSHPEVGGAGEQGFFFSNQTLRSDALDVDPELIRKSAERYLAALNGIAPGYPRITDKFPGNYLSLGVIRQAFPHAKIIFMRRHPVDNCLSIWSTPMKQPPPFGADKANIVVAYRAHERLMKHWQNAVPKGVLLEVRYEDLITDHEATVRSVAEFLELEFDPAMLHHEDNTKTILTPSFWQARQPIFSTSKEKWRMYEPYLEQFASLLEPK